MINMIKQIILIILLGLSVNTFAQTDRQFVRDGNRLYRQKAYDKAEVMYRKAISKNPSNSQAVYNLGCALMMQSKDSAAVMQYQNATKLEKNKRRLAFAYHNIGVICQNHKMYGDAIKAYEQALRNNPKDDETRYNLALCKKLQKKQGNKDDKQKKQKKDENKKDGNDKQNDNEKDKDKNKKKESKPQEEQMSKDNAEQLLNAAMQSEKATQQRMKKALQKPNSRRLEKNW